MRCFHSEQDKHLETKAAVSKTIFSEVWNTFEEKLAAFRIVDVSIKHRNSTELYLNELPVTTSKDVIAYTQEPYRNRYNVTSHRPDENAVQGLYENECNVEIKATHISKYGNDANIRVCCETLSPNRKRMHTIAKDYQSLLIWNARIVFGNGKEINENNFFESLGGALDWVVWSLRNSE